MTPPSEDYRIIPLTNSALLVKVSPEDYDRLRLKKWHLAYASKAGHPYARRTGRENGKAYAIWMHREILGLRRGDGIWSDHIDNRETLDNRRSNLRKATPSQNNMNRRSTTGEEKGVSWFPLSKKWRARIKVNRKEIHLGLFVTRDEAVAARQAALSELHGEFARTR